MQNERISIGRKQTKKLLVCTQKAHPHHPFPIDNVDADGGGGIAKPASRTPPHASGIIPFGVCCCVHTYVCLSPLVRIGFTGSARRRRERDTEMLDDAPRRPTYNRYKVNGYLITHPVPVLHRLPDVLMRSEST